MVAIGDVFSYSGALYMRTQEIYEEFYEAMYEKAIDNMDYQPEIKVE